MTGFYNGSEINSKLDITDVVSKRVNLKKNGSSLLGLCPFHNEKTPSFHVNLNKQFYHCFGCGEHGSAIDFVMKIDSLSFVDACNYLIDTYGLSVSKISNLNNYKRTQNKFKSGSELNLLVAIFFKENLKKSSEAIDYIKKRGISGEVAAKFLIGFADSQWNSLVEKFPNKEKKSLLVELGLIIKKKNNDGYVNRFRNRIMFPIQNNIGQIIGFGGRVIDNSQNIKYMNSPESIIFNKGNELFGVYQNKDHIKKKNQVILVEGYMDVIRLHHAGIKNAVAALGTSVTERQIKRLFQLSDEQIYCFDGDQAGIKASQRLLKLLLTLNLDGKNVSFTLLPSGMDPDVLIEKVGPKKFSKFFQDYTIKIENFLIKYLSLNLDMKSVSGKATFKRDFNLVLQKLPQSEFKFFLNKYVNEYIYKKKYENIQIKFEYEDFVNRPIYKILTILYHNNLKMDNKLISQFYKSKSRFEKNYGSKVSFAIDFYIKEGASKKFKLIINEILADNQESEKLLDIYTNFFKSFKKEEILKEFNETFSILLT